MDSSCFYKFNINYLKDENSSTGKAHIIDGDSRVGGIMILVVIGGIIIIRKNKASAV